MSLLEVIRREIRQTGPITIARYMELCHSHPEYGYYVTWDPLGAAGDFTTAPEISQMFGEMFGAWVAMVWVSMGRPDLRLVELGPGRGTLAADVARVLDSVGARPEIWLVETSPALRSKQAERIPGARWAESFGEIPPGPSIILANEFFDALPVRQYLGASDGVRERVVGLTPDGALAMGLAPAIGSTGISGWGERSAAGTSVAREIASRLEHAPGGFLMADYGYTARDRPSGPTLQAVRQHRKVDPLSKPGETDLTWLVDFDALARDLAPLKPTVTTQGAFLAGMGIGARAEALARRNPEQASTVADALERLTSPQQMGTLFKVLGAVSNGLPPPPGFEDNANACTN